MALPYVAALDTLFYPFESGKIQYPAIGDNVLFLNAAAAPALQHFSSEFLVLQQYFKPYADVLKVQGYNVHPDAPNNLARFDCALLHAPKTYVETVYLIARALQLLKPKGTLVVAAGNKAGGGRLAKTFAAFGLKNMKQESRNKARVVWACKSDVDESFLNEALIAGQVQTVLNGTYLSWPGIYGWNKIDQGSALLAQNLPADLSGMAADFGCGYGFLARHVLEHCQPKSLTCVDADWRALEMCRQNLRDVNSAVVLDFLWLDCMQTPMNNLDFVVMNPPFHEGKTTDISIGEAFIVNSVRSLKPGGHLWMVANRHLPYERILTQHFTSHTNIAEAQGFKIFCAQK